MEWPSWRDGVFSLRTFSAAMLAAWVSLRLDLSSPGTAAMTVYIVSQPMTGMMLSKSVYRVFGTLAGALATLVFIDLFVQARELFVLASALWFAICVYISVLLRDAPAAYGPMLAGYTLAIIGFPAVLAPQAAFDLTVTRCTEILLGIGCAGVLSAVVMPRPVGPVLYARIEATLDATARWAVDILSGQGETARTRADQTRLIADVVALETLRSHAVFDTRAVRLANDVVRQLQGRLFAFLAVLVSIRDREQALRQRDPAQWQAIEPAFDAVARVMDRSLGAARPTDDDSIAAVRQRIESCRPAPEEAHRNDQAIVAGILLSRLQDVLTLRTDCLDLRDHLAAGTRPAVLGAAPSISRHRDQAVAVNAAVSAFATLVIGCTIWIETSWTYGSAAATMIAISCGFFSAADRPAQAALNFLKFTAVSAVVALFYMTLVLPQIDGFAMLVAALAVFLLPVGLLMTAPNTVTMATPLAINFLFLLSLGKVPKLDLAAYLNTAVAVLAGCAMSVALFALLRPLGTQWVARRLVDGIMVDLGQLASGRILAPGAFESRMFDRINGLLLRLDPASSGDRPILQGSLAALRVGQNVMTLRRLTDTLPPLTRQVVESTLSAIALHFHAARHLGPSDDVMQALARGGERLRGLDSDPDTLGALTSITAIRLTLSYHAAFFGLPSSAAPPPLQEVVVPT